MNRFLAENVCGVEFPGRPFLFQKNSYNESLSLSPKKIGIMQPVDGLQDGIWQKFILGALFGEKNPSDIEMLLKLLSWHFSE